MEESTEELKLTRRFFLLGVVAVATAASLPSIAVAETATPPVEPTYKVLVTPSNVLWIEHKHLMEKAMHLVAKYPEMYDGGFSTAIAVRSIVYPLGRLVRRHGGRLRIVVREEDMRDKPSSRPGEEPYYIPGGMSWRFEAHEILLVKSDGVATFRKDKGENCRVGQLYTLPPNVSAHHAFRSSQFPLA